MRKAGAQAPIRLQRKDGLIVAELTVLCDNTQIRLVLWDGITYRFDHVYLDIIHGPVAVFIAED